MSLFELPPNIGYSVRPYPGESVCGDACGVWFGTDRVVLAVADGLGHGPGAAEAAEAALRCIGRLRDEPCEECFAKCDQKLISTRGVALALAIIEFKLNRVTLATVGNISAILLTERNELRLGGARGIVGAGFSGLAPDSVKLTPGDILCMYSDGLEDVLPLRQLKDSNLDAQDIAASALSSWARSTDDASILVYRHM